MTTLRKSVLVLAAGVALGPRALSAPEPPHWIEVATKNETGDRVYVDTESIQKLDDLRIVDVISKYPAARTNQNNILLDRHVQKDAVRCADRAVVGIRTVGYLEGKPVGSGPETPDWRHKLKPVGADPLANRVVDLVCAAAGPAPTPGKPKSMSGSGIVVDGSGAILTNHHVVKACKAISVRGMEGHTIGATVQAVDPKNDLALLKAAYDAPVGEPATFRAQAKPARLGEQVGVVGFPLAGFLSNEPKATFGEVSSVAGYNNDYTLLQISAPVQPGNSGGPVFDSSGQVIGVVVSQASMAVAAIVGNVPQNVNFAIRGEIAQIFLTARGVHVATAARTQHLATEDVAALGQKSTVFIRCDND